MKDLTKDSITKHIISMAIPIAIGMLSQMAYQLVDLYFVTKLGVDATAGVSAAGNAMFVVMALTQVLGVGTVALIAHAVGRKDQADANLVFNQSLSLSLIAGIATVVMILFTLRPYMQSVAADAGTIEQGTTFMLWLSPCLFLMFPMTSIGSALRGTGIVQPTIVIQMITVAINAALAPVLIAGWGTGHPLGVAGAGLASSLSVAVGVVLLGVYFHKLEHYVAVKPEQMRPQTKQWRRMLNIGLPAGGEFVLMFLFTAVVYYAIRNFGASAQAGFGIGSRVLQAIMLPAMAIAFAAGPIAGGEFVLMFLFTAVVYYAIRNFGASAQAGFGIGSRVLQAIMLPAMAIAFAAGPIAGQNFGAKNAARVRETFRQTAIIGACVMAAITLLAQINPNALVNTFNADAQAIAVAALFLQMISWNFVAQGLVFTCSSMFQGLGNTMPSLISSATRLLVFSIPAIWLSMQPQFQIEQVWYLSIASATLQAIVSFVLLRLELRKRLAPLEVVER